MNCNLRNTNLDQKKLYTLAHNMIVHGFGKVCPNCPQILNRQLQEYHIQANCDNEKAS